MRLLPLLFLLPLLAFADAEPVVNKLLETQDTVTVEQARSIYLMKTKYTIAGVRPELFRMPLRSRVHAEFVRDVLDMNPSQFDKEWLKLVNAGLATEIAEVDTEQQMIAAVGRKPRGVGYLSKDFLVLNVGGSDVKIVRIVR